MFLLLSMKQLTMMLCKWISMNQPNMASRGLQDHNTMPKYHLLLP